MQACKRSPSTVIHREHFAQFCGSMPGTWLRDKELVRSHHLPGELDSGYKANSIAFGNHTYAALEVNNGVPNFQEGSLALVPNGLRLSPRLHWLSGGHNAAVNPK
jgi:hypothetical protein